jgi:predicted nucleic acid-binding protein
VYSEISSALYKRFQAGELSLAEAQQMLDEVPYFPIRVQSPVGLARRAFEIAAQFRMKWVYDAFYVALAEVMGCELWTADARLHEMVHDAYPNVRLLTEFEASA